MAGRRLGLDSAWARNVGVRARRMGLGSGRLAAGKAVVVQAARRRARGNFWKNRPGAAGCVGVKMAAAGDGGRHARAGRRCWLRGAGRTCPSRAAQPHRRAPPRGGSKSGKMKKMKKIIKNNILAGWQAGNAERGCPTPRAGTVRARGKKNGIEKDAFSGAGRWLPTWPAGRGFFGHGRADLRVRKK